MKNLALAILAGICIALGGTVFLRLKDAFPGGNVVGALLFTIGLFTIVIKGFHLFTGKACYIFDNPPDYLIFCVLVWFGNLIGTSFIAVLERMTVICGKSGIDTAAAILVKNKMDSDVLSLFVLGFLCNIFIYIAVNIYAKCQHELGKYLALFLGVSSFILGGTEHSVADMYYWAVSGILFSKPFDSLFCILIISLGNVAGGVLLPLLEKIGNKN